MNRTALRKTLGWLMVGDGAAGFASPRVYLRQLQRGNGFIDDLLEFFAEQPRLTRALSALEVGIGLWLAVK